MMTQNRKNLLEAIARATKDDVIIIDPPKSQKILIMLREQRIGAWSPPDPVTRMPDEVRDKYEKMADSLARQRDYGYRFSNMDKS